MEFFFVTLPVFLLLSSSSAFYRYRAPDVEIYHMNIRSDISFRFATTEVSALLKNNKAQAREAEFRVTLPKSAFISNFFMKIDGELYQGKVKPKMVARREYTAAQERGESAAHVAIGLNQSNDFIVTVNLPPYQQANFNLTYQELLQRRHGFYQHLINISPTQYVQDLRLDVNIRESRQITMLRVPSMRPLGNEYQIMPIDDNSLALIDRKSPTEVYIGYTPCIQDQFDNRRDGLFTILYDVEREFNAGELQLVDGYFVHFFAPPGLDRLPKDIAVILDVSGSMHGEKLRQTKEAMMHMLSDLRPTDRFSIITFASSVRVWSQLGQALSEATPGNVRRAKLFVQGLQAGGGTNINTALLEGIERMVGESEEGTTRPSLIVLLTDGRPTAGITSESQIISNIEMANRGRLSLFSLGFGNYGDFNFLKKLSLRNKGFARKIYTGIAAAEQLKGFYDEISSPIMSNVTFSYLGESVDANTVTDTNFANLFDGSELIAAGRLRSNSTTSLPLRVSGRAAQGDISLNMNLQSSEAQRRSRELNLVRFTEKLWAYLTIQRLLDRIVATENTEERSQLEGQATEMSLRFNFVTNLTSMVVTTQHAPNENVASEFRRTGRAQHMAYYYGLITRRTGWQQNPNFFADNDLHFVIDIGLSMPFCFDNNATQGRVLQLIHDNITGIMVATRVVGPSRQLENDQHDKIIYSWTNNFTINDRNVVISISNQNKISVTCFGNVTFGILRHMIDPPSPSKVDYLGFYIRDGQGLSLSTRGLIGKFLHKEAGYLNTVDFNFTTKEQQVVLGLVGSRNGSRPFTIRKSLRCNMYAGIKVPCWYLPNNSADILGEYISV